MSESKKDISTEIETTTYEQVKQLIQAESDKVLQEAKNEISRQNQLDKVGLITIYGLFASVTSFLTIEFQFLKNFSRLEQILGFAILLFVMLLGFNLSLDYLIKSRLDKETPKPHRFFITGLVILFILGIFFMYIGHESDAF